MSRTAHIRDWANEAGYEVGPRGRIPRKIIEAYNSAHTGEDDVNAATESAYTLDDAARIVEDDPGPSEEEETKTRFSVRITKAVKKDIEGKVAFLLGISGSMWSVTDPYCAQALMTQAPVIAEKLTPIICQSPDIVRWFSKSGNFTLYLDLMIAVFPVVSAIFAHHIAKGKAQERDHQEPPLDSGLYVVQGT